MRRTLKITVAVIMVGLFHITLAAQEADPYVQVEIGSLATMPPPPGQRLQAGLAGAFSGIHNNVLIVAGGANFPEGKPWEGGEKVWWDDIYVLEKAPEGDYNWVLGTGKLPVALAYGVSIPTEDGIVCIGGDDGFRKKREVFLLSWDIEKRKVVHTAFPDLPIGLAYMAGGLIGQTIYIAGGHDGNGASKVFLSLDLNQRGTVNFKWRQLEPWPGPERILPMASTQSDGANDAFFLFGGRNVQPSRQTQVLGDAYKWIPTFERWEIVADIKLKNKPINMMAGQMVPSGAHHILAIGHADGKSFLEQEALAFQLADTSISGRIRQTLLSKRDSIQIHHPGFKRELLVFNTITEQWSELGLAEVKLPVTTQAFYWNDQIIIPSGEISPGIRTPEVYQLMLKDEGKFFGYANYVVITVYLVGMVLIGFYFLKNQKSTGDYFKGNGRIPWWAAGISIFGTLLSAITFMAIPARTFATDWSYFMLNMSIIIAAPIIANLFIPFYARLNITSAYEYLEMRFNLATRLMGSISFILFQLGRIAIVLFLPSIAISILTGINVYTCILVLGLLSIVYSTAGGIEAVIWTDVIQVVVLLGGALLSLFFVIGNLSGGFNELMTIAIENDKFNLFNLKWDLHSPTFWTILLGGIASNIISQGTDQSIVQRYLTATNAADSKKTLYTNAVLTFPATILFFLLGTALFVFYKSFPDQANPLLPSNDGIFPFYIVSQLPAGVAGLLIAALLSAAMSSLSSSLNSGSAAFTTDFYKRFRTTTNDKDLLFMAKIATVVIGLLGTAIAMWMATATVTSLWDEFQRYLGLFVGGLGGVFLLGLLFKMANGKGAVTGLLSSGMIQFWLSYSTKIHLMLYTLTGLLSCVIIGYLASFLFNQDRNPKGLTVYDQ
ncbi:sodium/solute symporter [Fulvivirgaceae bacterium BMA12]|uniref:Sodium/solute symporter n=1 Tax=Agaribacillus aureus TaxID=3051825 RepID=A0ABT8LGG1_9BACT|nr:sodium/solute symporter [Fulvivirgaceae bacterium BMA12]